MFTFGIIDCIMAVILLKKAEKCEIIIFLRNLLGKAHWSF